MNKINVTDSVTWVGKIDWDLRKFHGNEYSTNHGSSYNSFLIQDEKVALMDSVWAPYSEEFIHNLSEIIDLKKIDYVIANHAEVDHAGSLPELMKLIPDTPVYCTANAVKSLKGLYHVDWNFKVVKTGDRLSLGSKELIFIETPMMHWPDSMFSYLTGDNILFSMDAFGQHYASEFLFNDKVDSTELHYETLKYYANILAPFNVMVDKKIKEVLAMGLPIRMIAPSHGVIWRSQPMEIVKQLQDWANAYQENQITVVYDTMWGGTRKLADTITKGIHETDPEATIKVFNIAKSDKNDVVTEIFRSKALVVGSSTINKGILTSIAALIEEIQGLGLKNKKAATFGCYGWSGESVKKMAARLQESGFTLVSEDGYRTMWNPDDTALAEALEFGRKIGEAVQSSEKKTLINYSPYTIWEKQTISA